MQQQGGLPAAYQQVEYIASTGTQYINTGVSPTLDTEVAVDFGAFSNNGNTYASPFGLSATGASFSIPT